MLIKERIIVGVDQRFQLSTKMCYNNTLPLIHLVIWRIWR